jgi:type IV pilus assembly protein PilY1
MIEDISMRSKLLCLKVCVALTALAGSSVRADDTEVFFSSDPASTVKPNVLLILDTSGSMHTEAAKSQTPYDANHSYSVSGCSSSSVYYSSDGSVPACNSTKQISKSNFYCTPATTAFSTGGKYTGFAVRWMKVTTGTKTNPIVNYTWWPDLDKTGSGYSGQAQVTCKLDADTKYPLNGSSSQSSDYWKGTAANNYFTAQPGTSYTFYDGNYIAWLNDSTQTISLSRMDIVREASKSLIDSLSGVNVGLMSYDATGDGGMIRAPVQDVTTGATSLKTAIDGMHAGGLTPLSETLYEAYLYYSGGTVKYGTDSKSCNIDSTSGTCPSTNQVSAPSVPSSISGSNYISPVTSPCQNNYIVFLTDGLPYGDGDADTLIENLDTALPSPGGKGCYKDSLTMWQALGYSATYSDPYYDQKTGLCLKEMSRALYTGDLNTAAAFPGKQNVTTYFIGFGNNVGKGAPQSYLADAAKAGGGTAEVASDATELASAFDKTIGEVLNTSATFTSPSIAVNSFNKTQVLEDLYVAMFEPSKTTHWPGNLKKFKLRDGKIVGQDTAANAVNPANGFFTNSAKDFWQSSTDTNTDITTKGGAANNLPVPSTRNVYTYIGTNHPSSLQALSGHPFTTANSAITASLLTLGGSDPDRDSLIEWARGDSDGDPRRPVTRVTRWVTPFTRNRPSLSMEPQAPQPRTSSTMQSYMSQPTMVICMPLMWSAA